MGYSDTYPELVAKLAAAKGSTGKDASGYPVPIMTAQDMVAVAALYFPGFAAGVRKTCSGVFVTDLVNDDGVVMIPGAENAQISAEEWLSGVPLDDTKPYQRIPPNSITRTSFEPGRTPNFLVSDETDLIKFTWAAAYQWQTALETGAACMLIYGTRPVSAAQAATFLASIRSLGSSIDVLGENPPPGFLDLLPGALHAALNASAKSAGELAAGIGNVAGDVAGDFLGGLFSSANLVTLAILGVVAWKLTP